MFAKGSSKSTLPKYSRYVKSFIGLRFRCTNCKIPAEELGPGDITECTTYGIDNTEERVSRCILKYLERWTRYTAHVYSWIPAYSMHLGQ